jgi:quercetin dioxygenase-like cupin family protein
VNKLSLTALANQHLEQARTASSGRSAHTVFGGHEHTMRQTLIALLTGQSLSEHENPGEATLHVLRGRIRLDSGADSWDGSSGDLITVPLAPHSVHALDDSVVLLTAVPNG